MCHISKEEVRDIGLVVKYGYSSMYRSLLSIFRRYRKNVLLITLNAKMLCSCIIESMKISCFEIYRFKNNKINLFQLQ